MSNMLHVPNVHQDQRSEAGTDVSDDSVVTGADSTTSTIPTKSRDSILLSIAGMLKNIRGYFVPRPTDSASAAEATPSPELPVGDTGTDTASVSKLGGILKWKPRGGPKMPQGGTKLPQGGTKQDETKSPQGKTKVKHAHQKPSNGVSQKPTGGGTKQSGGGCEVQ